MTRDEVRQTFIEILLSDMQGLDPQSVSDSTSLITDLSIGSTRIVDVVLETEARFGIEIDSESMDRFLTVGSAVDLILEKVSGRK